MADSRISWSERPGCFERHLQRRYNNPLFSPERQHVTAADVAAARRQDAQDLASLRAEYVQLLSEIAELPDFMPFEQFNPIRERIQDLIHRAVEVGGEASETVPKLRTLRHILIQQVSEALSNNPRALKALQEAEAFHQANEGKLENQFLAQMLRDDTPITAEDVVPSILTEDVATIRTVMAVVGEHLAAKFHQAAVVLVEEVRARGETVPGIDKKLATLGTTSN